MGASRTSRVVARVCEPRDVTAWLDVMTEGSSEKHCVQLRVKMQLRPRSDAQANFEDIEVVRVTLHGFDSKEAADEARCKRSYKGGTCLARSDFLYEGKSKIECLLAIEADPKVFVFILPSVRAISNSGSRSREVPAEQTLILIGARARIADSASMNITVLSPEHDVKISDS
mmetsp:Transcript_34149/g.63307  ORF Transcript_34149/g.63307 Transcript_34149/m.63307 type:complete len:172 (-) Transcript_34149:411-926(-)